MKDGTRVVHAGLPEPVPGQPFLPGPVFAAPYHLDPVEGPAQGRPGYGRPDNPTRAALEAAIGELEGGECVTFASGMAAIAAVLQVCGRDSVVVPSDGYFAARALADQMVPHVRYAPTAGPAPDYAGASLVLLESPANPGLDMCDLPALSAAARAAGAVVAVDNTTATPLGQRPLDLGADISMQSATKFLGGHSDLLSGVATTRAPDLAQRLRDHQGLHGATPGALESYLALRGPAARQLSSHLRPGAHRPPAIRPTRGEIPAHRGSGRTQRGRDPLRRADSLERVAAKKGLCRPC